MNEGQRLSHPPPSPSLRSQLCEPWTPVSELNQSGTKSLEMQPSFVTEFCSAVVFRRTQQIGPGLKKGHY